MEVRKLTATGWSVVEALLLAVTAVAGIWWPAAYARETANWRAQAVGGDVVNLVLIAPLLVWSAWQGAKGSLAGRMVWFGAQGYTIYFFFIYAFAVHFNALFPVYCAVLGLSVYGVIFQLRALSVEEARVRYEGRAPRGWSAAVLLFIGVAFGLLWLSEVLPAAFSGETPRSVVETGLLVNPVHVLDLSLFLPCFVMAGVWMLKRRAAAWLLAPVLMTVGVLMSASIVGMMIEMGRQGVVSDGGTSAVFAVVTVGQALVLWRYLRVGGDA